MDEDDDDPVPLPNVNGAIMRKVSVLQLREERKKRPLVCLRSVQRILVLMDYTLFAMFTACM